MPSFQPVRSVLRALRLLELVNQRTAIAIQQLHLESGLPKPTIVRLIETLMAAGYLEKDYNRGFYHVTVKVNSLSRGLRSEQLAIHFSLPRVLKLTERLKWPISVAILEGDSMVIRLSTAGRNRLSPIRQKAYARLNVLTRAHGLAYLAFCPAAQRSRILRTIGKSPKAKEQPAIEYKKLKATLRRVRKAGFAERDPEVARRDAASTIAVPILLDGKAVASIGLTYYPSVTSRAAAVEQYVGPLRSAAEAISGELDVVMRGAGHHILNATFEDLLHPFSDGH